MGAVDAVHMAHQAVRDTADAELPEVHDVARQSPGLIAEDVRHLQPSWNRPSESIGSD